MDNTLEPNIDILLDQFHGDVEAYAKKTGEVYEAIKSINPFYSPSHFSELPQADLLANIVAGIYAPLIHSYSHFILMNIASGNLSNNLFIPPRDAIPVAHSIKNLKQMYGLNLNITEAFVNRKLAGVYNNQSDEIAQMDALFDEYILQEFGKYNKQSITELETGIYGTTTLALAESFKRLHLDISIIPIKWHGLGSNISYSHMLLTDGSTQIASQISNEYLPTVNQLMVLLDTMEELGMQNMYQSPNSITLQRGKFVPVILNVDSRILEIANATNNAVIQTSRIYNSDLAKEVAMNIVYNIGNLIEISNQGIPLTLKQAIPSMDDKDLFFREYNQAIQESLIKQPLLEF